MTPRVPSAPVGPGAGLTSDRAQQWVLVAALITTASYGFRRLVETDLKRTPAHGSSTQRLLGSGSPPPPLSTWAFSYGAAFSILALIAFASPEIGGSLAILSVLATVMFNSQAVIADLGSLQGTAQHG